MWFVEIIWCRKRVLFDIFTDFDSQMDILKVYLEYLPKMFIYSVDITGSVHMSQDDKVSKYYSDSDVDGGNCEGDVEVMATNEERNIELL